jgi:rod shape-determining protein MreC
MAERPEALARLADKLVLALWIVLSLGMMSWDEQTRVERGSAWAHRLTTPLESATQVLGDLGAMRRENEDLRAEIASLRMDFYYMEAVRARVDELESRAGFYERDRGRLVPATVLELIVSRVPVQAKIRTFSNDSLRVWMPVVNERGLVGRIRQVLGPDEALVQLLTEEDSRISVEIVRTEVTGLLRYDGRQFHIDHVPQGEPVAKGDPVMSSGLGRTVPRGLRIGTVKSVTAVPTELFQQIEVETRVRFSAIRRVFVITDDGPWYTAEDDFAPDLDDQEDPRPEPTP